MTDSSESDARPDEPTPGDAAAADPDAPDPGRLDLRVARVVKAREHTNADRLLLLDIDLGDEERQIVAGIVNHYELDELDGKHIVVVANLQPAEIRGEKSEGMLLAAENEEDELGLLLAPEAEPGQRLRPASGGEPADEITFEEFQEHDLRSGPLGVRVDGEPLSGARFEMDRGVYGPLR